MKAFIAALVAVTTEAVTIGDSSYHPEEVTYYEDHTYKTYNPQFFYRDVPVEVIEKYYHAHSDASDSSQVDSLKSDYDSYYSDECPPWRYDCTDSSDYSKHSSDDSGSVESHDHDHGYYGYDYFASDDSDLYEYQLKHYGYGYHNPDLHSHYRVTERHEKVPEV